MQFCPTCESKMAKITPSTGNIIFQCRCLQTVDGDDDDTLMAGEYLESTGSELKHEVFVESSPFDPAAQIVLKDCPNCPLDFMIMIVPGENQVSMYTCSCGYKISRRDYASVIDKAQAKKQVPK